MDQMLKAIGGAILDAQYKAIEDHCDLAVTMRNTPNGIAISWDTIESGMSRAGPTFYLRSDHHAG